MNFLRLLPERRLVAAKPQGTCPPWLLSWARILLISLLLIVLAACGSRTSPDSQTTSEEPLSTSTDAPEAPAQEATTQPSKPPDAATPVPPPSDLQSGPAAEIPPVQRNDMYTTTPPLTIDPDTYYYATLKTDKGDIKVQLFAKRSPVTVNNFVFLARQGFYDNTVFHRVLDGFMAQGGDPTGTGAGGPGYVFEDEFYPGLVFDQAGLLAMANRGPGTNGSQFFITFAPTDWLNERHTIFGKVIAGEEVLAQLTRRDPTTEPNAPADTLYTIVIEESGESVLPTPTPAPPTATPTSTPTPYAPTELDADGRPLAELPLAERVNYFNSAPELVIDTQNDYTATISTSKGDLVVALYDDQAPMAVNNFIVLADLGFYDDTPISLVRPGDSIIFGVPDNNPLNDAGYKFAAEVGIDVEAEPGVLAYIPFERDSDGAIRSSSSQILIALIKPPPGLNSAFSFFGQIVDGLDVLDRLTTEDTIGSIVITEQAE